MQESYIQISTPVVVLHDITDDRVNRGLLLYYKGNIGRRLILFVEHKAAAKDLSQNRFLGSRIMFTPHR